MNANNRMIVNTVVMYARLAITMVITLLSSRWVLLALGEEDFGIYNLVAGLLGLLMFLNLSMATASQRYLSYALGKKDNDLLSDTFFISIILHFIIGVVIFFLVEIVGQYLLYNFLQVPFKKIDLAVFCLHSLAINAFVTVISVPYRASLISHENIMFVALTEVGVSVLKLILAIVLLDYLGNRLKLYAVVMTLIPIMQALVFRIYSKHKYPECRFKIHRISDYKRFKDMAVYASWNMIGSVSSLLRDQGIPMLLNSFYGVCMNTAYGLALQVKGQLNYFSSSIVTATKPQIVKSEGAGNRQRSLSLSAFTCKVTFLLLSMLAIPLIVDMPYILHLWLKIVPEYTISFTRIVIVICLVYQFAIGISIPVEAVGRIKHLQILVGGLHMLVIPVGFIMLHIGMTPNSIFLMIVCEEVICVIVGLFISKRVTGLNVISFLIQTIIPCVIATIVAFGLIYSLHNLFDESFIRLCGICVVSILYFVSIGYLFVFTKDERKKAQQILNSLIHKLYDNN